MQQTKYCTNVTHNDVIIRKKNKQTKTRIADADAAWHGAH